LCDSRKDSKVSQRREKIFMSENEIAKIAVNICFNIHKEYGPGLFESVYEGIFVYEWQKTNIPFMHQ